MEASAIGCSISADLPEFVEIRGDEELLRRAFENVIRNAIRYSPNGTQVEVSLNNNGDEATISVRDRGPGIPKDLMERVFDPFFRVDPSREEKTGGLGLGLAIARRAIRVHHGDIVAVPVSTGALFEITLPMNPKTAD